MKKEENGDKNKRALQVATNQHSFTCTRSGCSELIIPQLRVFIGSGEKKIKIKVPLLTELSAR